METSVRMPEWTEREKEAARRLLSPLKLGRVTVSNRLILAPMAGVSDLPFRLLCREMGAGMVCTEMISAKALTYHNRHTGELMRIDPGEHPVSLQLFGSDPEVMAQAARQIREVPFDVLDVNMGCPVPKVAGNGEGSALMRDPELVRRIVCALTAATDRPVTIKIRKGFDESHVNAVEIARIAQESGAAAVAVHGRTREQYYSGEADWGIIAAVKRAVDIPVIGNGDVTSPQKALAMAAETGCDAVMIARGARGNPWLFGRTAAYLSTGIDPGRPGRAKIREMILRHARRQIEYHGEQAGIREMRGHVAWYTTGLPHSARLRASVNAAESFAQLERLLNGLAESE